MMHVMISNFMCLLLPSDLLTTLLTTRDNKLIVNMPPTIEVNKLHFSSISILFLRISIIPISIFPLLCDSIEIMPNAIRL